MSRMDGDRDKTLTKTTIINPPRGGDEGAWDAVPWARGKPAGAAPSRKSIRPHDGTAYRTGEGVVVAAPAYGRVPENNPRRVAGFGEILFLQQRCATAVARGRPAAGEGAAGYPQTNGAGLGRIKTSRLPGVIRFAGRRAVAGGPAQGGGPGVFFREG